MLSVKTFVKGGFALSFVADLWNNENTKMKMQTKAILKTTICFFCFFSCLYYFLIPQHYYKLNFLSTRATKSCSGFCHVRVFTYLSVAKNKRIRRWTWQRYKLNLRDSLLLGCYFQSWSNLTPHIIICNRLNPRSKV